MFSKMHLPSCFSPTLSFHPKTGIPKVQCGQLHDLFGSYSTNGVMSVSQFCSFLREFQMESDMTEAKVLEIMKSYPRALPGPQFHYEQFLGYLFDDSHNLAINNRIHHNMNLPLTYYYIFTGHNSYLTGNQISSASSEKPIAKALKRGVRVIELDLWPSEDDISVFHGGTLTSKVEFEKCLQAIKENAFSSSPYPVIVTLEDHLTPELQEKAAKVIKDIFGDYLYYPDTSEELKRYPSPEDLKYKILISTKPPQKAIDVDKEEQDSEQESSSPCDMDTDVSSEFEDDLWIDETTKINETTKIDETTKTYELSNEGVVSVDYARIITIKGGKVKGKSLIDSLKTDDNVKRVSVSEPRLAKIAKSDPAIIIQFTLNNFLRVYPKGLRIDSSNYNPIKAWALGAQMVALNMQGYDKHLWITQGFFRGNGGCGYIRKPDYLISEDNPVSEDQYKWKNKNLEVKQTMKVKVYMGYGWKEQFGRRKFDTFSPPDFYTRIGIAGVKKDSEMKETPIIYDKWEPIWDMDFDFMIRVPELAVLRIEVFEADKATPNEFAGQISLPVNELKSGYRVVPLYDKRGDKLEHVKLMLHLQLSSSR